jgi:hypothetical protein
MYRLFSLKYSNFSSALFVVSSLLSMRCGCTTLKNILTTGRKVLFLKNQNVAVYNMPVRVIVLPARIAL